MNHRLLLCLALPLLACRPEPTQPVMTDAPAEPPSTSPGTIPPVAKRVPTVLVAHEHERVDEYYWMREREDPEVLAYLEQENAYTKAMSAHTAELRAELEAELAGRVKQDDSTVPTFDRGYYYIPRYMR